MAIERRNGAWRVRVSARDTTGKRTWLTETYATKREAERGERLLKTQAEGGPVPLRLDMTLAEYCEHWLLTSAIHAVQDTSAVHYRRRLMHGIAPLLGHIRLQALTSEQIQAAYTTLLTSGNKHNGKGLSAATVVSCHTTLNAALAQAVRWRMIPVNPAAGVSLPRMQRTEMTVWDATQVQTFLDALKAHPHRPLFAVSLRTGMRIGELIGLRWRDVDLDARRITLVRNITQLGSTHDTKSGRPRVIALGPDTVEALRAQHAIQAARRKAIGRLWHDQGLVFTRDDGEPLLQSTIRQALYTVAADADLPRIRIHDLRHTHATLLLRSGVNVKVVSERLGHASIVVTLQIYAHVLPDMQQEAADLIDTILRGDPDPKNEA